MEIETRSFQSSHYRQNCRRSGPEDPRPEIPRPPEAMTTPRRRDAETRRRGDAETRRRRDAETTTGHHDEADNA